MKREAVPDYGATEDECRAYFSACAALRKTGVTWTCSVVNTTGNALSFALYDDVRALPQIPHGRNFVKCTIGSFPKYRKIPTWSHAAKPAREVDAAAAQHRTAALLSVEGADLLDCALITWKPWPPGASD